MKSVIFLIIFAVVSTMLFSDENQDLKFAIGLFSDQNFNLAEVELRNFIEKYPESRFQNDARFLLGNIYLEQKKYSKSQEIFSDLYKMEVNPALRGEILFNLAQSEYFLENSRSAKKYFLKFQHEFPDNKLNWKANYFLGKISFADKNPEKALEYFDKASSSHYENRIETAKLEVYLQENEPEKAEYLVRALLEKAQKDEFTYQALTIFQQNNLIRGEIEKIFQVGFEAVPASSGYFAEYNQLLGIAYFEKGEVEKSLSILENYSSDKALYYKALCYLELDKTDQAKAVFVKLYNESENANISANSYFYLAKLETDKQKANSFLEKFISDNPQHKFVATAYYLMGYNYFFLQDYPRAEENLKKVLSLSQQDSNNFPDEIFSDHREMTSYLLAESYFYQNKLKSAFQKFSDYINIFPEGKFVDEALFKQGLYYFEQKDLPEAYKKFSKITTIFPESGKTGMSYFYQGEILFNQSKYQAAKNMYEKALAGRTDRDFIWLKVAYIYYYSKDYKKALSSLINVSDQNYEHEKNMLQGNILFAEKEFGQALDFFDSALANTENAQQKENAMMRKAWTLYQMQEYEKAAAIYNTLSITSDSPDEYILKGADSAFNAENYRNAIELYRSFLKNFPDHKKKAFASLGIADCYYNLGNFAEAAEYYRALIDNKNDFSVFSNALNGLKWAVSQVEKLDFRDELEMLLRKNFYPDRLLKIYEMKFYYEYDNEIYSEVIKTASEIIAVTSDKEIVRHVSLLKAISETMLEKYEQAERSFQNLNSAYGNDSEILYNWAQMKIRNEETDRAAELFRKAAMLSRESDIWLELLQFEFKTGNRYFGDDYHKFMEFARDLPREKARLLWIENLINLKNYAATEPLIKELLNSSSLAVKARAQFLKGFSLYEQGNFAESIPALLRVRYLYPEIETVRIEAEYYACQAYIESGKTEEAKQLFDVIEQDLSTEMRNNLQSRLEQR